jgi:hypothetical protein
MRADRGDVVGAIGHGARAVFEAAHASMCARGEWVLNEKRLIERAGVHGLHAAFLRVPAGPTALADWVDGLRWSLDAVMEGR